MMMGVPVIASDLPGVRIPIQKTGMGKIVSVRDSYKLAETIYELLKNKKKFNKNYKYAGREFSVKKTVKFYDNLLRLLKS